MLHRLSLLLLLLCSAIVAPFLLVVYDLHGLDMWKFPAVNVDGYVKVYYNKNHIGTTKVINNNANPVWEEHFMYEDAINGKTLYIKVYDKDVRFNKRLGICTTKIMTGFHEHTCDLITGGKLKYKYSLL